MLLILEKILVELARSLMLSLKHFLVTHRARRFVMVLHCRGSGPTGPLPARPFPPNVLQVHMYPSRIDGG